MDPVVAAEQGLSALPFPPFPFPTSGCPLQTGSGASEKLETWVGWWGEEWGLLPGVPGHIVVSKGGDCKWYGGKNGKEIL